MVIALSLLHPTCKHTTTVLHSRLGWLYDWSRYKHRKITSIHGIFLPLGIRAPFFHTTRFTWLFSIQWRHRFSFIHPLSAIHLCTKQYFLFEAFIETLHLPTDTPSYSFHLTWRDMRRRKISKAHTQRFTEAAADSGSDRHLCLNPWTEYRRSIKVPEKSFPHGKPCIFFSRTPHNHCPLINFLQKKLQTNRNRTPTDYVNSSQWKSRFDWDWKSTRRVLLGSWSVPNHSIAS